MYQVSRAIYRELSGDISGDHHAHEQVLRACESTVGRMVSDRHYFARPARTLFHEVRPYVDVAAWPRVWHVIDGYVTCAQELLARLPATSIDANGYTLQCRATTRRGTPCQRTPLHHNGYCPSHQHLAETEEIEVEATAQRLAA